MRPRLLRRRPLDFSHGHASAAATAGVDVIVPVYFAFELLERCLASVARHTDLQRHGLLLVLDGPGQQPARELLLRLLPPGPQVRVLENPRRLGFVGSVNRGMAESRRDVLLLNSDTEVGPGWLEQLQAAAAAVPSAATVTPFSNDATLCSLPRPFEANRLPAGHDTDSFARLVARVSAREYPRLPTGVGVCLYIKRAALERVGPFDAETFGLGYGEENDFCFRALGEGFVHLLDDATFVYHAGHGSFGRDAARLRRAARALARKHPAYMATIAACMRADPPAAARARVLAALRPPALARRAPERVLHVVHGWPPFAQGGSEQYARGLAQWQSGWRDVAVYARVSDATRASGESVEYQDGGVRVRLVANDFSQRDPLARNALRNPELDRDLERLLADFQPQLAHVHHLAGHALSLLGPIRRRHVPIVWQLQDWWPACARTSLLNREGQPCPGPTLERCTACFDLTRVRPAALTNRALHLTRRRMMRAALQKVQAIVAGSQAVVATHRDLGLVPEGLPVHVLRYGVDVPAPVARDQRRPGAPLRFGCVSTLMPHKGLHVAVEAFDGVDPAQATLELWGQPSEAPEYVRALQERAGPAVLFRGPFADRDKSRVLGALDVLIVPSLGLESFSLVVAEAAVLGVPSLASAAGALVERVAEGCGQSFPPGDARALRGWIERLQASPRLLEDWRLRLPAHKSVGAHAAELEAVYAETLRRRSSARS